LKEKYTLMKPQSRIFRKALSPFIKRSPPEKSKIFFRVRNVMGFLPLVKIHMTNYVLRKRNTLTSHKLGQSTRQLSTVRY
jgi:hypothetical protein